MAELGPGHDPGVRENARLTSVVGIALLVPLLAVTLSGLSLGGLWRVHYFAGFLLIPLVAVKLASTGYRAARYYLRDPRYRGAGPPAPLLRALAPLLVLSGVLVLGSGVVLWKVGSRSQPWSTIHSNSAVVFLCVAGIHVLAYVPRAWREVRSGRRTGAEPGRTSSRHRAGPRATVIAALTVGLVVAIATIPGSQPPRNPHHRDEVGVTAPSSVPGRG